MLLVELKDVVTLTNSFSSWSILGSFLDRPDISGSLEILVLSSEILFIMFHSLSELVCGLFGLTVECLDLKMETESLSLKMEGISIASTSSFGRLVSFGIPIKLYSSSRTRDVPSGNSVAKE